MKLVLCSLFVVALPFAIARADQPPPHHAPPPAAFEACAKLAAGDTCSVAIHDHTITGVCSTAPDSMALFCRPDHPPGPPPAALAACNGKAAGDACAISHDGREIAGSCDRGPSGDGALACHPSGPPPHS
jgi:hypothetical protein